MRRLFSCLLVLVSLGCEEPEPAFPEGPLPLRDEGAWAARRARIARDGVPQIEQAVLEGMARYGLPSVAAAALVDGRLVWWGTRGVRDLERGDAADIHTVYRIGSLTKVFTAMALLRLRDEGRLSLDEPAASFIPELSSVVPPTDDSGRITIRQIVTHTSGLPSVTFDYSAPRERGVSEREILESLRGLELEFAPGSAHRYSNLGYAVLGIVVGRAAAEPYDSYVSRTILAPMGMRSARWSADDVPHDQLATGYAWIDGQHQPRHHWKMGAAEAMGGLYASLDDMVRFVAYQMTAWPPGTRPDRPPLRNATLRESHQLGGWQPPFQQGTGLGWGVTRLDDAGPLSFHAGQTHMYVASVELVREARVATVVMSNSGRIEAAEIGKRIREFLVSFD